MKPFFDTTSPVAIPFGQANFPAPFASGLEYSSPPGVPGISFTWA